MAGASSARVAGSEQMGTTSKISVNDAGDHLALSM
jgi:hypothetical protein